MKKKYLLLVLAIIVGGSWFVFSLYNKPHRDPATESSIKVSAIELFNNYEKDEAAANGQYLDKVIEVSGEISEITTNQESFPVITLETGNPMFGIRCTMKSQTPDAKNGDSVVIKGICTGYLSDVIIVNGSIVE